MNSKRGFTLLEILISIGLFGVIMGMLLGLLASSLTYRSRAAVLRQSTFLAESKMNELLTQSEEKSDKADFTDYPGYSFETQIKEEPLDIEKLLTGVSPEESKEPTVAGYYQDRASSESTTGLDIKMLHYMVRIFFKEKQMTELEYFRGTNF